MNVADVTLRVLGLLVGGSIAVWFALISHDLRRGFARFERRIGRAERPEPSVPLEAVDDPVVARRPGDVDGFTDGMRGGG